MNKRTELTLAIIAIAMCITMHWKGAIIIPYIEKMIN